MKQPAERPDVTSLIAEGCLISIVDDEESVRDATKSLLRSAGYRVRTFASAESFLDSGALEETACLILDVRMPGLSGLELQDRLNEAGSCVPIIFISAHADGPTCRQAWQSGAVDVLRKPFAASDLLKAADTALQGAIRWRSS